jgi:hypothetical protein
MIAKVDKVVDKLQRPFEFPTTITNALEISHGTSRADQSAKLAPIP